MNECWTTRPRHTRMRLLVFVTILQAAWAFFPSFEVDYCLHDVSQRDIPQLTDEQAARVKSLEQIQAVVRHGARTPYKAYQCWEDYTVTWTDCNVTELMLESPSYTSQQAPATWLFRKIYNGSPNYLKGNCYTGQLLLEGYHQEEAVGSSLKNAYLQGNFKLFPSDVWTDINTTQFIYLRSDDEQRTLMSGQILLHSMFQIAQEVIVPWHTGDYGLDQMYPNSAVCPRLNDIEDTAYSTKEWLSENSSKAIGQLNMDLDSVLGVGQWSWNYIFDCMMTTVCSGRPIPDGNGDTHMSDELFNATLQQYQFEEAYLNLFNNSAWSKLAMANTGWHLRTNLENMMKNISGVHSNSTLKFALFAGHDTTVMPLLAAILGDKWDRIWPGYASLLTFELYQATESTVDAPVFLFRLVYNSKPLLVPGCDDSLCDVSVLLSALSFGVQNPECQSSIPAPVTASDKCSSPELSSAEWSGITVVAALFGALIGAAAVVLYDRRMIKTRTGYLESLLEDSKHTA